VKCLVESSVELRGRNDDAGHNAQMYLAEWLEPRAQHSGERGGSGDQGGKTRFAYFAAHDLNRQAQDQIAARFKCGPLLLRPHLRGAIHYRAGARRVASAPTRLRCRSRHQVSLHCAPDQPRRIGLGFRA
jgi:hypothetical protein